MPTTIHRAVPADIPVLVGLMAEFHGEAGYALDRTVAAASFTALLQDERRGAVWLARVEGEPAGHVVMTLRFSMEFGGLDAFIDDLFVRGPFRRRGVGRRLMATFFSECQARELRAVHVEAGRDNAAAGALYAQFGLKETVDRRLLTRALVSPAPR